MKLVSIIENISSSIHYMTLYRPGLDEWRKAWKYNKKLERILLDNNLR